VTEHGPRGDATASESVILGNVRRALVTFALLALVACTPSSVVDAEAKRNVGWLDHEGSAEAVAALGRLADSTPTAVAALDRRAPRDPNAYLAAWNGTVRGAPWGASLLRTALADPARADVAAGMMGRGDPHLATFIGDFDAALLKLAGTQRNASVAAALVSVGAPAHDTVEKRMADAKTRGVVCRAMTGPSASDDARNSLISVPMTSRDDEYCVQAVVKLATGDDGVLTWMASFGEPGILSAAGNSDLFPCARLGTLWMKALVERSSDLYTALVVPLTHALKRCPAELDATIASALTQHPAATSMITGAIDPFVSYGGNLPNLCAALPAVARSNPSPFTRERARDALAGACKLK
jgi:hypothetical protein